MARIHYASVQKNSLSLCGRGQKTTQKLGDVTCDKCMRKWRELSSLDWENKDKLEYEFDTFQQHKA